MRVLEGLSAQTRSWEKLLPLYYEHFEANELVFFFNQNPNFFSRLEKEDMVDLLKGKEVTAVCHGAPGPYFAFRLMKTPLMNTSLQQPTFDCPIVAMPPEY